MIYITFFYVLSIPSTFSWSNLHNPSRSVVLEIMTELCDQFKYSNRKALVNSFGPILGQLIGLVDIVTLTFQQNQNPGDHRNFQVRSINNMIYNLLFFRLVYSCFSPPTLIWPFLVVKYTPSIAPSTLFFLYVIWLILVSRKWTKPSQKNWPMEESITKR